MATSQSAHLKLVAVILANPEIIEAYLAGIPGNGKPFPRWRQDGENPLDTKDEPVLPGYNNARPLHDVDFRVKNSKRFADSGGMGGVQI